MTELITTAQMRAIEADAIESGAVTGLQLMERAAHGVVAAIARLWPGLGAGSRAMVLCGPGNNGGDGFAIARMLANQGWRVQVLGAAGPDILPPDAAINARRWLEIGPIEPLTKAALCACAENDLYVDAIFGAGLTRAPQGDIAEVLGHMAGSCRQYQGRTIAVDAPSGLSLDTGRSLMDPGMRASVTVSFHRRKIGHVLADGPELSGACEVADIGLTDTPAGVVGLVEPSETGTHRQVGAFSVRWLEKADSRAHKFNHGHAVILSGGMGRSGAARLAARAAIRIGAGVVTLGAPGSALMEVAAQITALMLRRIEDAGALTALLDDARITALCLGPGLGLDRAASLVPAALSAGRPCVLDADALSALAQDWRVLSDACVLTPHGGEFARLFPDLAARLTDDALYSKVDATRDAAARCGAVIVFKGADTVVSSPDGRCAIHSAIGKRAVPWLATAGAGDVLAGMITGLMARGCNSFTASIMAAWLHAEAARAVGPGLIAEDLPEALPHVLKRALA